MVYFSISPSIWACLLVGFFFFFTVFMVLYFSSNCLTYFMLGLVSPFFLNIDCCSEWSYVLSHYPISFALPVILKMLGRHPWLVWLSGLSAGLQTKGLLVWFPVRAHAWAADQVPSVGPMRDNHTLMFLSLSFSFPSVSLKRNK